MKRKQHLVAACVCLILLLPFGTSGAATIILSPDPLDIFVSDIAQMTVTLDELAGPGGSSIDLALSPGTAVSAPSTVTILDGFNSALFYVSGLSVGSEILTASLGADIGTATINVTNSPVPVPAAVWLFGSGVLGLLGIARRKRAA